MTLGAGTSAGFWRRLARDALAFQRSALAPLPALRNSVAIGALLAAGLLAGNVAAGVSMAAGALLAGISSLLAGPRPVPTMVAVTVAMSLATFVGSASGALPALHIAILVPWAFAAGMAGAVSPQAATVGLQSAMAMIVFGRFAQPPAAAAHLAGYVFAGGATQAAFAFATGAAGAMSTQRRLVADAYDALGDDALGGGDALGGRDDAPAPAPSTPPGGGRVAISFGLQSALALDVATRYLEAPAGLATSAAQPLSDLVAEGERIRLSLAALASLATQSERRDPGAGQDPPAAVLAGAAPALRQLATSLRRREQPLDSVLQFASPGAGGREAAPPGVGQGGEPPRAGGRAPAATEDEVLRSSLAAAVSVRADALAGQVRAAARLVAQASGRGHLSRLDALAPRAEGDGPGTARADRRTRRSRRGTEVRELLRANTGLQAPQFRHALRLAVVLPLCEAVAALASLQRGYWIALTAGVVLRPDFGGTVARGVARVAGTVLGAGIAGALVLAHPGQAGDAALVVVSAFVAFTLFQANYVLFSSALTALVVLLLGLVTSDTAATAGYRLLDTVIGGAIALAASRLWPTWSARDARYQLVRLVAAQRGYARLVFSLVVHGGEPDREALAEAGRRCRRERAAAEQAVARALADPASHRIDPRVGSEVLGSLRRFVFALHVVRAELEDRPAPALPEAADLGEAIQQSMSRIGNALARLGRLTVAVGLPPLRELHTALVGALAGSTSAVPLLAATDEMVDAIDTAAEGVASLGDGSGAAPA